MPGADALRLLGGGHLQPVGGVRAERERHLLREQAGRADAGLHDQRLRRRELVEVAVPFPRG